MPPPPAQADRRRRTVLVPPPPGRPACGHGLNHGGRGEGGWADRKEAVPNVVGISHEVFKGESYTLYVKGYPFIMPLLRVRFTP